MSRMVNKLRLSYLDAEWLLTTMREFKTYKGESSLPSSMLELRRVEYDQVLDSNKYSTFEFPSETFRGVGWGLVVKPPRYGLYTTFYRPVLDLARDFLTDPKFSDQLHWRFEETTDSLGERTYSELWTSDWWKQQPSTHDGVLALILSSDATHVSFKGTNVHPVYLTLGNFDHQTRHDLGARKLVGFIPIIASAPGLDTAQTEMFRQHKRKVRTKLGHTTPCFAFPQP